MGVIFMQNIIIKTTQKYIYNKKNYYKNMVKLRIKPDILEAETIIYNPQTGKDMNIRVLDKDLYSYFNKFYPEYFEPIEYKKKDDELKIKSIKG